MVVENEVVVNVVVENVVVENVVFLHVHYVTHFSEIIANWPKGEPDKSNAEGGTQLAIGGLRQMKLKD